jgi:lysophospholipase L1-like esterase
MNAKGVSICILICETYLLDPDISLTAAAKLRGVSKFATTRIYHEWPPAKDVEHSMESPQLLSVFIISMSLIAAPVAGAEHASSQQAVPQNNSLFLLAHQMLLAKRKQGVIDVYFLGDSITRRWQATDYPEHQKNWDQNFRGWNAANFGWGGDTTQNVLWRLQHGELDGVNPKVVVLMIGTNNVGKDPPTDGGDARSDDVAHGIRAIVNLIREKSPAARIVLMGITPRNDDGKTTAMPTIDKTNARISQFADGRSVVYLNINKTLADADGKLFEGMTEDGLHLSVKGYQVWADALKPLFSQWLGPPADIDRAPPASGIPVVTGGKN